MRHPLDGVTVVALEQAIRAEYEAAGEELPAWTR
jgi:hypothetical protein